MSWRCLPRKKRSMRIFYRAICLKRWRENSRSSCPNPPYIASAEVEKLMPEVRDHEPRMALTVQRMVYIFYRRIIEEAGKHLVSSGMLFFEIGYDQGQAVSGADAHRRVLRCTSGAGLCRSGPGSFWNVCNSSARTIRKVALTRFPSLRDLTLCSANLALVHETYCSQNHASMIFCFLQYVHG